MPVRALGPASGMFAEGLRQRCMVTAMCSRTPPDKLRAVAAMLKAVRPRENREVAQRNASGVEQTGPAVCYDSAG